MWCKAIKNYVLLCIMRRILLITFIVVLCGGFGVVLSLYTRNHKSINSDPFLAVSSSAALIVETQNIQEFVNALSSNSGFINELRNISDLSNTFAQIDYLNSWFGSHDISTLLNNNASSLFIIETTSAGDIGTTLIADMRSGIKKSDILALFHDSATVAPSTISIDNHEVYSVEYPINNVVDSVFMAIQSGLVMVSSSAELINNALTAATSAGIYDIRNNASFSRLFNISTTNEDHLYLVYSNLPSILKPLFNEEWQQLASKAGSAAAISGFDIFLDNNSLFLNGYTDGNDNVAAISEVPLHRLDGFKILPASTALFELFDYNVFGRKEDDISTSLSKQTATLLSIMKDMVDGEIIKAYIDIKGNAPNDNKVVIYHLKDPEFAKNSFQEEFLKTEYNTQIVNYKPDNQISFPIYQISMPQFAASMLPNLMWEFDDKYFAFYENYLITGCNYATVTKVIYDNILHKTLANDVKFREFETSMPSTANFWLYFVPAYINSYFSAFLSDKAKNFLATNGTTIDKIQAIGYQSTQSNGMLYNNISVQYKNQAVNLATTEWETLLDTTAAIKPFFFTNHNTKAKEIFIQDLKNNIYLINSAGRVLWKVPIQERIEGDIYMIDIFKNGRNQLLFAGKNYLHLIDRNGNYVDDYPVRLRSAVSNGLALFDYDNNKNYRLVIAGEDKQVYVYDKNGAIVKGWDIFKANDEITTAVSWVRSSGRDYLIVTDKSSIYFLDRTGKRRLTLKESVSRAEGSALRLVGGRTPMVVCSAPDGTVQQMRFDGTVSKLTLGNFSNAHHFDLYDIDGDGLMEYIYLDNNKLSVYNNNGALRFEKQIGSGKLEGILTFSFSSKDKRIGVYAPAESLIYLIDSEGNISDDFPIRGKSLFSIGHLSSNNYWNLVVAGDNNFVYNYKMENGVK